LNDVLKLGVIEIEIAFDGRMFRYFFFAVKAKGCSAIGVVSREKHVLNIGVIDPCAEIIFGVFVQKFERGHEKIFGTGVVRVEAEGDVSIFGRLDAVTSLFENLSSLNNWHAHALAGKRVY
jgi:hypothetical protein